MADVPDGRPGGSSSQVSDHVTRDGNRYRWLVDVDLWRDTTLPLTVFRIILLVPLVPAVLLLLIEMAEGSPAQGLRVSALIYAVTFGIVLGLSCIMYPLYVLLRGGRYSVRFEMDDEGVDRIHVPAGHGRGTLLARLGVMAGLVSGDPTVGGSNLLALSRKRMHTRFSDVRKVVVHERECAIKLIARDMTRNWIHAQAADFELIRDLVLERCRRGVRVIRD